ncbi:MAG: hypothetical protein NTY76_08165, partial [Candidatus Omnitrophica bacterium]|nr:hypothetical protein [Candidatus Omnitrophota bacterium]
IEIVKSMLLDKRSELRLAAIEIADDIGRSNFGAGIPEIPLKDKINIERQEMAEFIYNNDFISQETDRKVLSSYEDLLFGWWAHQDVADEKILSLLGKIKYDAEYRIFRYYTSKWDIGDDVREKLKDAPSKDRWPWVVDNILQRKWNLKVEDFKKDAAALNDKYPSPAEIISFLCELDKGVTITSANALFLKAWFEQAPTVFKEIRSKKNLWKDVPMIFKYTISYELVQKFPEMAEAIINEVLLSSDLSIEESKIAINILSFDISGLDKYEIVKSMAEKNIDDLNLSIIEQMRFIGDKISAKEMAEIVLIILNHLSPTVRAKSMDHIAFILHDKKIDYINEFLKVTWDVVHSILINTGKLTYYDFRLASLMLVNVKELADFIETRLEQEKKINKYNKYEAIPYDGINFLEKVIKNPDDYLSIIEKVLSWDEKYKGNASFSVSKIFEQIVSLKNKTGKLYLDDIKSSFYNGKDFSKLLSCLFHLPLNRANIDIFNEAIQKSKEFRFEKDTINLLKSKIHPEGGWSSSAGEVPPAFIDKKDVFQVLKDSAPVGLLKNALDVCVASVDKMIEDHKTEEENLFYSR